jgi:uncharacterized protein (TIGR03435 family)
MTRWIAFVALVMVLLNAPSGHAQDKPPLAFEVASIKAYDGFCQFGWGRSGTLVRVMGHPIGSLILRAYGLNGAYQLSWKDRSDLDKTQYNVTARAAGPVTDSQIQEILQSLLAARFQLRVHRETKEMPVYALVVDKNGPKLKESAPDTAFVGRQRLNGPNPFVEHANDTLDALTGGLTVILGRPVLNKTGLTAKYDYKVAFSQIDSDGSNSDSGSLSAALHELGPKLEPRKENIEMLVVDHVEKPSEN